MHVPTFSSYDDARIDLFRRQRNCDRLLLLEDDMRGSGLGSTTHMMTLVLLFAHSLNRTLVEVPSSSPRWCVHSPWTLQCYYEPWSACGVPPPPPLAHAKHYVDPKNVRKHDTFPVVHMSLMRFYKSNAWYGTGAFTWKTPIGHAATDLLFLPRAEFRLAADRALSTCGIHGAFAVVHLRNSSEKNREHPVMRKFDIGMYTSRVPKNASIFWQTASLSTYHNVRSSFPDACFTQNHRNDHDDWVGKNVSIIDESARVAVLNGEIGRRATWVVSHPLSKWTWFIGNSQWVRRVISPM